MATSSHHISKILIHTSHARERREDAGSTVVSAVPSLRELSRPSDPKKWKDVDVSKGTRWKICLAALQVVFKNVCYFSPFNVEILKMLTFQWTATLIFDHLNGILQNQKLSVAVMSVSISECPDDPEGNNCGKAISCHFNETVHCSI